ncbi:ABC transporter ATP-binding protein [Candidatus Bathyarchaeota archaeon]|nr:ABC transporter ATP-binding protein [Candidatus Bathyarchaeota archaeon]
METPTVVRLENLEKSYRLGKTIVEALRGISFLLHEAEFMVVMGPSGSGKTTLLNIIGTLDKPTSGHAFIDGEDIGRMNDGQLTKLRRFKIGFVFQFHNLIPVLTALENVQLPMLTAGLGRKASENRANELLGRVGLKERVNHLPDELSGGEQQRVAIARALANHPRIILADEPTGDLDTKTGSEVVEIMHAMAKDEKTAVVVVTHDPIIAAKADRLLEMRDGRIVESTHEPITNERHALRAVESLPPEPGRSISRPN